MQRVVFSFLFLLFSMSVAAQDSLPKISVKLLGKKALVSWINPFETITSINIQRSGDSVKNFKSIGSVLNVGTVSNGFVDPKEFLPNDQYYRLFITFEGGNFIFTEAHQPVMDTSWSPIEGLYEQRETSPRERSYFVASPHVYIGKDQNVVISLHDAKSKKYRIRFYTDAGAFLFELKKITEPFLVLDKANFFHSGLFRFEIFDGSALKEVHKIYIPKPGKPVPPLDIDGYEIRR